MLQFNLCLVSIQLSLVVFTIPRIPKYIIIIILPISSIIVGDYVLIKKPCKHCCFIINFTRVYDLWVIFIGINIVRSENYIIQNNKSTTALLQRYKNLIFQQNVLLFINLIISSVTQPNYYYFKCIYYYYSTVVLYRFIFMQHMTVQSYYLKLYQLYAYFIDFSLQ